MFCKTAIPLTAATLLSATLAQAQMTVQVGPRVGLNVATAPFKDRRQTYDTKFQSGVEAGVEVALGFGHLSVQPALVYSQKGFQIEDSYQIYYGRETITTSLKESYRLSYLAVPINLVYSFGQGSQSNEGLQLFAGPYVSALMGGKYKYDNEDAIRDGSYVSIATNKAQGKVATGKYYSTSRTDEKFYSRGFDCGFQVGLGYRVGDAQFQLGYSRGLANLGADFGTSNSSSPGPIYSNRVIQASFSYFFGDN
ncbi:hypothetical protein CDA63_03320 [Hymenobacter amundsenii]|uniref:Outer membrane protein beta-barrel domain-containing protein n=1 Tax=Hymenobacter amundsenii TaxID=2006685 RepID=A0A246FNU1_9BACT|nr:porin family protein [Hymenobacter amundsenii]OWP64421.1 hypothetical protein CDA63_03320 [Hymenobacter amundsenii]